MFIEQEDLFLLFQELLESFHPLSDLSCVVQAEEGVLWGQLWQLYPMTNTHFKTTETIAEIIFQT